MRTDSSPERNAVPRRSPHPLLYFLRQSAAWDWNGYPVFARRWYTHPETTAHAHSYYEVVLAESGTADHITVDGIRKLRAGDLIVIRPGMWHQYKNTRNFQLINCLIDRKLLRQQREFLHYLPGGFQLFLQPISRPRLAVPTVLHASPSLKVEFTTILEAIIREREEKASGWQAALMVHMLDLMIRLSRVTEIAPATPLAQEHTPVYDVVSYLEENFRNSFSLAELSAKFHISESYLSRTFSKHIGVSLVNYLHHLRIEEACRMLLATRWTVSRIAGEVGYDEFTYFSRRFRREMGMTPKQYRQGHGTSIAHADVVQ